MADDADAAVPEKYRPDEPQGTGRKLAPTYEVKPPDGYDNGGYERVRSWEYDESRGTKRNHYAAIHRLCAVAWSDRTRPLEDVLADLYPEDGDANEVHHVQWHRERVGDLVVETDLPCGRFANIEGNLVVVEPTDHANHHDHLDVCHPTTADAESERCRVRGD